MSIPGDTCAQIYIVIRLFKGHYDNGGGGDGGDAVAAVDKSERIISPAIGFLNFFCFINKQQQQQQHVCVCALEFLPNFASIFTETHKMCMCMRVTESSIRFFPSFQRRSFALLKV